MKWLCDRMWGSANLVIFSYSFEPENFVKTCQQLESNGHANVHTKHTDTHADVVGIIIFKKAPRETQTLRAGCSMAKPKNFAPQQTPLPGAQDGQNVTSWRWLLPLPANPVWWRSMHAISSYRGNSPRHTHTHRNTHKQTNKPTDRTDYNTLCR